uniref:NADH-ubiquinone oxidoreductase chain 4L n=1 Tax=Prionospio plumosa TaxID=3050096 RepID=A0AAU6QGQ9_9ANNE
MSISIIFVLSLLPLLAILAFISQRRHVLMCLLSLEAALLSLAFMAVFMSTSLSLNNFFFCVVILSFGACEAAVALAVLVVITRTFGSDSINAINLSKC